MKERRMREEWEVRLTSPEGPEQSVVALFLVDDVVSSFVASALEDGWRPDQMKVLHRKGVFFVDHECEMEWSEVPTGAIAADPGPGEPN